MKARILMVLFIGFLTGCVNHHDDNIYFDEPNVVIRSTHVVDSTVNRNARIFIELENIGYATAYDVAGSVDIIDRRNVIETDFFDVGFIRPDESVIVEIVLTSVDFHDEYDEFVIDYEWYDAYDNFYYY